MTAQPPGPAVPGDELPVTPAPRVAGRVRPPGSKSITNRALVIAALADGRSVLEGALDSEDSQVMFESWRRLGVAVSHDSARQVIDVAGCSGEITAPCAELWLANSGTSMRFLCAAAALGHGAYRLDGCERMRARPIEPLLAALRSCGADARSERGTGCPPVRIRASGLNGGSIRIRGAESSQFASALLMAAPYAQQPVELEIEGVLVSEPFVRMTTEVMRAFGVAVEAGQGGRFRVPTGHYAGRHYAIEPDATAASYLWAAAALTGGEVTVEGLGTDSIQGDMAFLDLLERMGATVRRTRDATTVLGGALRGVDADMRAISDTALTLAVVAAFADGPTRIRGVAHTRAQETDRVAALACELRRMGAGVDEHEDGVSIRPAPLHGARIETYNDHRIAMSFALAGLRVPGIRIANPACTAKTYPGFFDDLRALTRG